MQKLGGSDQTAAVALVADMLFASRVRGAAAAAGVKAVTVTNAGKLFEEVRRLRPRLVLIDLEMRGVDGADVVARLKSDPEVGGVPIIAFGSHVNRDALQAAHRAGADRVLARSAFVRELPELLEAAGTADPPGS